MGLVSFLRSAAAAMAALAAASGWAAIATAEKAGNPASVLRDRYEQVRQRLEKSPYGRPLWLDSRELARELQGDAYTIVGHNFNKVAAAMAPLANWCELLILPVNTKHCESSPVNEGGKLAVFVGRKNETPLDKTYRLDFDYALATRTRDYFQVVLTCEDGPLGTRNYRIVLEATPIDEQRTFIHLRYSYAYGTMSKMAMQAYLATLGASKVGFTTEEGGQLVKGMRGVMERNTMRYALAIEAYLASLDAPQHARVSKRLNDWFSSTERYPRQLGEDDMDRTRYLAMKQREYARLASTKVAAGS